MAIQHRRGPSSKFDPTRMLPGEWGIVLEGDPDTQDGCAAYICFATGKVKRVATAEDVVSLVANSVDALADELDETIGAAERLRVAAEATRVSSEQARTQAEQARATAETGRATAEGARATAETARVTAEQTRATNETGRVSSEQTRVSQESARATAETQRGQAEDARRSAETGRAQAEALRASAEETRELNEMTRTTNEETRVSSETQRQAAWANLLAALEDRLVHVCRTGEYDPDELMPTVADPLPGIFYFVPDPEADADADSIYLKWMWLESVGRWELFGGTGDSTPTTQLVITFEANGGSGTMEVQTAASRNATLEANAFTYPLTLTLVKGGDLGTQTLPVQRPFAEWNTEGDGSGTVYADGERIGNLMELAPLTSLYAQWGIAEVEVSTELEREGFFFRGWSTDQAADSGDMSGSIQLTANATYYAIWERDSSALIEHATLDEYTISELQTISADLTANGSQSAYYQTFTGFLGQTKNFGARTGDYAGSGDDAKVIAQLVGICHDDLADGSGKAGLTFLCNRSLAYAYQMNSSDTNSGGWSSSKMRTTLNSGEVYQSLPADLVSAAVAVLKQTNNTGNTSDRTKITTTSDKFWLASAAEMWGPNIDYTSAENVAILPYEGTQYEWFANNNVTWTSYSLLANRNQTNTGGTIQSKEGSLNSDYSWLRSPSASNANYFMHVNSSGQRYGGGYASYGHGVCVGFSI